jgi:hypothetical protein
VTPSLDAPKRLLLRVGERWFEASPQDVRSVEAWQTLIDIPWRTRFLGLLLCRGEMVPVLHETGLGCSPIERKRIAICAWGDGSVGIPASEVRLSVTGDGMDARPLEAALHEAWDR